MSQPTTAPSTPAPAAAPGSTATETVSRPEPGLARGKWEAPPWAFWVALTVVLAGTTLYVLRRMGKLTLPTKKP